ncbi:hypothetical protein DPMN_114756 [Dreissena polymorpha]|uniref:Uncharacterized protein n=1 Tax=Dreissena polymorpha TaxID=45954 RepID=A0A9D4KK25_DREPO|nr:hypothetical protein DPMN_114756 [Dreissena polymorpha]
MEHLHCSRATWKAEVDSRRCLANTAGLTFAGQLFRDSDCRAYSRQGRTGSKVIT